MEYAAAVLDQYTGQVLEAATGNDDHRLVLTGQLADYQLAD